jgi:hypothetical protein
MALQGSGVGAGLDAGGKPLAESTVEDLQRENAELRELIDQLRKLLDSAIEPRTMLDFIGPEARSRMIISLSPAEIGPHLRELALRCVRLARDSSDARAGRELEVGSIELVDRANILEAIFVIPGARK